MTMKRAAEAVDVFPPDGQSGRQRVAAEALVYIIGFSINLLTLCAMVLAIAIVVDDAIVVV